MATRKVKPAPTEGKVTRKQAKAAVEAVMQQTNPDTGVEHWTQNAFNEYTAMLLKEYPNGDDFYKNYQWSDVNKMIDDVLSGKIVVDKQ